MHPAEAIWLFAILEFLLAAVVILCYALRVHHWWFALVGSAVTMLTTVIVFAVCYYQASALCWEDPARVETQVSFGMSVYASLVTFTNFGCSAVSPCSSFGFTLSAIESTAGYVFLALFVTLLYDAVRSVVPVRDR